jgi:hypothetical protein
MKFVICIAFYFIILSDNFLINSNSTYKIKHHKSIKTTEKEPSTPTSGNQPSTKRQTPPVEYSFNDPEYYKPFPIRLFKIEHTKCKANRCYPPFGQCINSNTCECLKGYINSFIKNKSHFCLYGMKSQLFAFLLETFTLVGGEFYLGFYLYAIIKLTFITIFFLIFFYQIPCSQCGAKELLDRECVPCIWIKTGTIVISIFGIVSWNIADLLKIMSSNATDSNTMPLDYFF